MANINWQQARALAEEAKTLADPQQENLVRRIKSEDAALGEAVEDLLDLSGRPAPDVDPDAPLEGQRLGAYRLIEPVGSGGMGTVYLAERADDVFDKRVAIKIMASGAMDPRIAARLRAERQILAALEHPNIARLLDGGTTPSGVPYIVMEHVEGRELGAYCDRHRLSVDDRLKLFSKICHAVHYAHRNLVVHRDLKPSNVLVTEDGEPKLLDFGIAKILDEELGQQTVAMTQANMVVMTPEYASPEQARGDPITTASDIYGLGIVLYELLTGQVPFRVSMRRPEEMFRVILEAAPVRPSDSIKPAIAVDRRDPPYDAEIVADLRRTTPDKLAKQLRGDLDQIILTALRKEPERRYASAQQFADDIRRYQDNLPTLAQPDSKLYRARKFARRHWIGLSFVGVLVVLASSAAVVFALQAARIAEERDIAEVERTRAQEVSDFLVRLTATASPYQTPTLRDLVLAGSKQLDDLDGQPGLQAELRNVLGDISLQMGSYQEAENLLTDALGQREELFGAESPQAAETRYLLGNTLRRMGKFDEALVMYADAQSIFEKIPDQREWLGYVLQNIAHSKLAQGQVSAAEQDYREAQRLIGEEVGPTTYFYGIVTGDLANALFSAGKLDEAENSYRESIQILATEDPTDPDIHVRRAALALVLHWKGEYEEAQRLFETSIPPMAEALGDKHPDVLGAKSNLGRLLHDRGDLAGAERLFEEVLAGNESNLGSDHYLVGYSRVNLATLWHDRGRLAAAEEQLRAALNVYDGTLAPDHVYVGAALVALGNVLVDRGLELPALGLLERGVGIYKQSLSEDHWQVADAEASLGRALTVADRPDEGAPLLARGHEILRASRGDNDRRTRRAAEWLRLAADETR